MHITSQAVHAEERDARGSLTQALVRQYVLARPVAWYNDDANFVSAVQVALSIKSTCMSDDHHPIVLDLSKCPVSILPAAQFLTCKTVRTVTLTNCSELKFLHELTESDGYVNLLELHVGGCKKLTKLPTSLPSLTKLDVSNCQRLEDEHEHMPALPSLQNSLVRVSRRSSLEKVWARQTKALVEYPPIEHIFAKGGTFEFQGFTRNVTTRGNLTSARATFTFEGGILTGSVFCSVFCRDLIMMPNSRVATSTAPYECHGTSIIRVKYDDSYCTPR